MAETYRGRRAIGRPSLVSSSSAPHSRGEPATNGVGLHMGLAGDHPLLTAIPAMLFTARPDGTWDYVSPPYGAYTGFPADALAGLGWAAALHPEDQAPSLALWQAATRSGTPWRVDHRLRGVDGQFHWFRTECAPLRAAGGTIIAWAGITSPLENERRLAAERAVRQQAERDRDASDRVIATVAHELRSPLTVILGQAKLLQRRLESNPGAEPRDRLTAATLHEQALRLSRLLSALMDTALVDHGELHINATTLDLRALVERLVQGLQPALPTHTLQLHYGDEPLWVKGDALRLEQVLQNLIQNAVKYSPAGSTITVAAAPDGPEARIRVSDQGIGIPASALPTLFQRFARARRSAGYAMVQGLGLGLYLCRVIMELHAGSIDVQSVEGEGCTVTLLLPRIPLANPAGARDSSLDEAHVAVPIMKP